MALMISTGAHYNWVKSISASTHGNGALKLILRGESDESFQQFNEVEITAFMDDEKLVDRLIAAINGAAAPEPPAQHKCENCDALTANAENDYGEFRCDDCEQNAAEAAYERQCEDFHGGAGPLPLREQQIQALKFK